MNATTQRILISAASAFIGGLAVYFVTKEIEKRAVTR